MFLKGLGADEAYPFRMLFHVGNHFTKRILRELK